MPHCLSQMEIPISNYTLFTLFCILFVILHTFKRSNSTKSTKTLPPGPWKLPIIGNIHQIIGSLPHHALRKLANKYGPIMHLQLGETSNVIVSSPEIAKEIYKTHDVIFANRPRILVSEILTYGGEDLGFCEYGSRWRHLRKLCSVELFNAKRVQSFRFIREEEVWGLVKYISANEGSIINLSEKIFSLTSTIIARAAFGEKSRDQEAFLSTLDEMMKLASGFNIADLFPSVRMLQVLSGMKSRLERVHKVYDGILENIMKDHRERKGGNIEGEENLLDVLFKIQQQDDQEFPLSLVNIKGVISDIFTAGSETSSTTIEWAMAELLKNPKIMAKAQAEVRRIYNGKEYVDENDLHQLKYLNSVIKETLRLHPPGPLLVPRENSERCVINGYEIPVMTRVIVNAWAIGRDPNYWTEPEIFQPERFLDNSVDFKGMNFEYIPFGAGRRICPGIVFAIPNMELPLANLLYHFDWKLPNGLNNEDPDMTEAFGGSVRMKTNLSLIPSRYHP